MWGQGEIGPILNLGSENTDYARVYKRNRPRMTSNGVRRQLADITPSHLTRYTSTSAMADPEPRNSRQQGNWRRIQMQEQSKNQDRFIAAVGGHIFKRGAGTRGMQAAKAEDQWKLLENIRQGRVDTRDINMAAGRPGYTSEAQNTRDPGIGLPPVLRASLAQASKNASVMNPAIHGHHKRCDDAMGGLGTGTVQMTAPVMKTTDYMPDRRTAAAPNTRRQWNFVNTVQTANQNKRGARSILNRDPGEEAEGNRLKLEHSERARKRIRRG
jgi:hypothetical protein